jgi:hypothetical protein
MAMVSDNPIGPVVALFAHVQPVVDAEVGVQPHCCAPAGVVAAAGDEDDPAWCGDGKGDGGGHGWTVDGVFADAFHVVGVTVASCGDGAVDVENPH